MTLAISPVKTMPPENHNIPSFMMQLPFRLIVIAPTSSGKSTPYEVQCIFFQQLKKDIETYDELKRMSDRDIKMKAKMAEYANKRKKHTKY